MTNIQRILFFLVLSLAGCQHFSQQEGSPTGKQSTLEQEQVLILPPCFQALPATDGEKTEPFPQECLRAQEPKKTVPKSTEK